MQNLLELLNTIKYKSIIFYVFLINATLLPGILLIYMYKRQLFISLDNTKLIFLSAAFTFPILLWNCLTVGIQTDFKTPEDPDQLAFQYLTQSSYYTMCELYLMLYVSYLSGLKIEDFIVYTVGLLVLVTFYQNIRSKWRRRVEQNKVKSI